MFCPQTFAIYEWYHFRKQPTSLPQLHINVCVTLAPCRQRRQPCDLAELMQRRKAWRGWAETGVWGHLCKTPACKAAADMSWSAVFLYELVIIVMSNDLYFPSAFILITSTICNSILPSSEVKQSNELVIYWVSWFRDWFYAATGSHLLSELCSLFASKPHHSPSTKMYDTMLLIINNLILIIVLHFLISCSQSFAFSYF